MEGVVRVDGTASLAMSGGGAHLQAYLAFLQEP